MFKKIFLLFNGFILFSFCFGQVSFKLIDHPVLLKNKLSINLKIPASYKISAAIEGLRRPRFFSKSPDGRLFITDMHSRGDNKNGRVLVFESWNDNEKKFEKTTT